MQKHLAFLFLVLFAIQGIAQEAVRKTTTIQGSTEVTRVDFQLPRASVRTTPLGAELVIPGVSMLSHPGFPKLPFYSIVVAANLSNIKISYNLGQPTAYRVNRLAPCEPEQMRCSAPRAPMVDRVVEYSKNQAYYRVDFLGDFRGAPLYRITFLPHRYNLENGNLDIYSNASFAVQLTNGTSQYEKVFRTLNRGAAYDYLVVVPTAFKTALLPWIEFKSKTQGLRFNMIELQNPTTADALQKMIKAEYANAKFVYALIVGSQQVIPNFSMSTTSTSKTPTDLPYFTMSGSKDFVPDVLGGRLVASNADDVAHQVKKWMDYESGQGQGWKQAVGIASNEGQNPSDEEYVRAMEKVMGEKVGTSFAHFAQNNSASNAKNFNATLGKGSMWSVYLGHGSGDSWPSFNRTYFASDVKDISNASMVKPVWIDVACQNGKLFKGGAGERLSNEVDKAGLPIGTTAYYGGTVNISWHPPAILATGITLKMVGEQQPILGSVIQMGHAYLAEKISDPKEIQSNQIWYHLQGDPSLRLNIK